MKKLIAVSPLLISLVIFPLEAVAVICNIKAFLDDCPTLDPAYAQIRNDFQLRRDGQLVGDVACQEPVSQLPIDEYTDELIILQGLRFAYYIDRGKPGQLPWTAGTLYSWLNQKIGGINITSTGPDECCYTFGDGKLYFNVRAHNDTSKNFARQWHGIADNIGLMAHERRHLDGAFSHVACCPLGDNACDQTYDESNLSPYAIHWWLYRAWIEGHLYTGYTCLTPQEVNDSTMYLRASANSLRDRFCDTKPPLITEANNPVANCDNYCWIRNLQYKLWLHPAWWWWLAGATIVAATVFVSLRYIKNR